MIHAAEAGRARAAGLAAIGFEGCALALQAGDAGLLVEAQPRAVVGGRLLHRAFALWIGQVALRFERLKLRLHGAAEADELLLTATVGGVRAREAIGRCRARAIEREHRLARRCRSTGSAAASGSGAAASSAVAARAGVATGSAAPA